MRLLAIPSLLESGCVATKPPGRDPADTLLLARHTLLLARSDPAGELTHPAASAHPASLPSGGPPFAVSLWPGDLLWISGSGTMHDVVPEFADLEGATTQEGRCSEARAKRFSRPMSVACRAQMAR